MLLLHILPHEMAYYAKLQNKQIHLADSRPDNQLTRVDLMAYYAGNFPIPAKKQKQPNAVRVPNPCKCTERVETNEDPF